MNHLLDMGVKFVYHIHMEILDYICYGLFVWAGLFMLVCIYKIGEAIA